MKKYSMGEFAKLIKPFSTNIKEALDRQIENIKMYLFSKGYQFTIISD